MKKEYKDYFLTQIGNIKREGKELQLKDENFYVLLFPFVGTDVRYTIVYTEKYDASKNTYDHIRNLLSFEERFIPEYRDYSECDPNEQSMFNTMVSHKFDFCPEIIAGDKFIPFRFIDSSNNKHLFKPDGKLLVCFYFYGSGENKFLKLFEPLYNKLKEMKNIEFKFINSIEVMGMTENETREKLSFLKDFPYYDIDFEDEETDKIVCLYNFRHRMFDTRVIVVNSFEKIIFNGPLNCEENIDYLISKINKNAFKENFEVTEEDEFLGKLGNRYMVWYYGKESFEQFKNKPVPDSFERKGCVFSYSNDTFKLKYFRNFD